MNKKTAILSIVTGATFLALPFIALALFNPDPLSNGTIIDPIVFFGKIFNFLWSIFTIVAVLLFITAGYMFLTANGEAGKIKTAKDALLWGIIGVIIAIIAFSIPGIIKEVLNA